MRLILAGLVVGATIVNAAYASPARVSAELRAIDCCSQHCNHARPLAEAGHCCGLAQAGNESARLSPALKLSAPGPTAAVPVVLLSASPAGSLAAPAGSTPVRGPAQPLFLVIRSLRL